MDTGQNAFLIVRLGRENPMMNKVLLQAVVPFPAVGRDVAAGNDIGFDKRQQLRRTAIVNHLHPQAAKLFPLSLNRYGHFAFMVGTTATLAATLTAEIKLVRLYLARQRRAIRKDCAGAEFLQPTPGGAITAKSQHLLQGDGIDARLPRRKPPQGLKPNGQRLLRSVKDGPCRHRGLFLALLAHEQGTGTLPVGGVPTVRANKPARPAQIEQIIQTILLMPEAAVKLKLVFREIFNHIRPPRCFWRPVYSAQ